MTGSELGGGWPDRNQPHDRQGTQRAGGGIGIKRTCRAGAGLLPSEKARLERSLRAGRIPGLGETAGIVRDN